MRNFILSAVILIFSTLPLRSYSQTNSEFQRTIRAFTDHLYARMEVSDEKSLRKINDSLLNYLEVNLPMFPESLSDPYDSARGWLRIISSADHKLRIWSWDDGSGGPTDRERRTFITLAEFQTAVGIKTRLLTRNGKNIEDPYLKVGSCDSIFSVKTNDGAEIYLPDFIYSSPWSWCLRDIEAFEIGNDTLITNDFVFRKGKHLSSSIPINFHCGNSWEPHNFTVRENGFILLVPHLSDKKRMTSENDRYEFNGKEFVYKGVSK